ncbi:MAG TPA: glutamate formimidoyltransferase [Anaerolineae bacterium]|nr:glutamate formimidoyltransferase [Anaerolineae bacterium]HIQ09005.1 glutamate formimidoyltransferase [Anaerolineaceae bacterium]
MSIRLVECIPNFSEGRRMEVVEQILDAITSMEGVVVLDRHSDPDHNRTVVTFVGPPEAVDEAAFRGIARAAELIDLNQHEGEHPRIGATDVVPFVPIEGVTMAECIEMARRLGKRVGEELGIPVYLYEKAATRPERENLENIRRGEYEALKEEIGKHPARDPDFGPARVGPAGATVIGARDPLIAFNVYLTTDDVSIASKIARAVRHSSGGLRYVKALGMLVEGRAQVSMNLTNYRKTPIARVVELIRREAQRYGVAVHHSELVGLAPQEALIEAARWYLQLDAFEPEQILERRLYSALQEKPLPETPEPTFLDELAAGTPTPGGGSAAAYTAAAGAALVAMVGRLTVGKKKYKAVEPQVWPILERAEEVRRELEALVSEDAAAFEAVMAARRLPKATEEQKAARQQAILEATRKAAQVPLRTARLAAEVLDLAGQMAAIGNLNAVTDAGTAAALAHAALTGATLNVRINSLDLPAEEARALLDEVHALVQQAETRYAEVMRTVHTRAGLD